METSLFFIISFCLVYALVKSSHRLKNATKAYGNYLQIKAFPSYSEFEIYKFSFLRILFGFILIARSFNIHTYLTTEDLSSPVGLWSFLSLSAAILLCLGLFTQFSLLFLIFAMWQYGDFILATSTLGNDVGAMLAVLLFLTGAGKHISLDSILINKLPQISTLLLYSSGSSNQNNIALAKFAALTSYWALCVYSLSMHLNEPAWMSGSAGPLLLTNNFMTSPYEFMESVFASSELAVHFARYALWAMMLWYPLILPFTLLGGIARSYIIIWGVLFFFFSSQILNLGSLAEIEFVFWAAIFWSGTGIRSKEKISVFYDDKCNLCDRTIQLVTKLDLFNRISLKPVSENQDILKQLNIPLEDALTDLYGVKEGSNQTRFGYDFYILLSKNLFLLWPLYPLLYLGKLFKIGPIVYRFIAKRRREMFGVCKLPSKKTERFSEPSSTEIPIISQVTFFHLSFLALCFLISVPAPYLGYVGSVNPASQAAHYYGISPINVFNKTDLRMAENWFTLHSLDFDENIPIFTEKGSRLEMHKSDRIYFGHTLRFRRQAIDRDQCHSDHKALAYLAKIYLEDKQAPPKKYQFNYTQYFEMLPNLDDISNGKYVKNERKEFCSVDFEVEF